MRLDNGELSRHLKTELGYLYFIHGAEDLLIIESLDNLEWQLTKTVMKISPDLI